ncbi:hypothetical protein G7Y89_g11413 [Cudoniella acicularis]|uniref:Uncharacterized protein n=1 Tax=Cudoniella acicularis TaxID=354080 RepID=A0A8H4W0N6_9HELO|nr:hypothetical protein G7Y89_g11413 [Cudoniella acicularis]
MEESPSKRRKTSPTTSIPLDATATPSRIPVLRQDVANALPGRPSFASPTRASIARHNPQLLNRPSSSGSGSNKLTNKGKNLDDVFAKVLGEIQPAMENQPAIQGNGGRDNNSQETTRPGDEIGQVERPITPKTRGTIIKGGLTAKPRRISRSPVKQNEKPSQTQAGNELADLQDDINPFQKKGLRRSPVSSQISTQIPSQAPLQFDSMPDIVDPFRKKGLRRSPVAIQSVEAIEIGKAHEEQPEVSTTPPGPVPSQTTELIILNEIQLQEEFRHAVEKTPVPVVSQSAEPVIVNDTPQEVQEESIAAPVLPQVEPVSKAPDPPREVRSSRSQPEEPDLPPTPTQRGLADPIVTTPPTGIHDTPSKKTRRSRALAEKLKTSPLKPRDPLPPEPAKQVEQRPEPESQKPAKAEKPAKPEKPVARRKSARFVLPEDPHAARKKTHDDLLKELQQLQADVTLANQENERLRIHQDSKKRRVPAAPNTHELLDLLTRSIQLPAKPKPKPASVFKSIGSFLPFSSRRKLQPVSVSDLEKPLPSHLPLVLDDPLPYLQAFAPLKYTSTITLLSPEPVSPDSSVQSIEQPVLQKHLIRASHPSGLFAAKLSMIVDSSTLSITEIEFPKLDTAAEIELGPFVRARARGDGTPGKDISVICWAMGRWTEVATKRARFWCAIESELCTPEAREKSLQKMRRGRKRKRQGSVILGEEENEEFEEEGELGSGGAWPIKEMLRHMGRTSMEISNENVEIFFEWRIGFDWTGEVESSFSATARSPQSWQKADDRKILSKIPNMFNGLVKESGPLHAVRAVVGLLMPTS